MRKISKKGLIQYVGETLIGIGIGTALNVLVYPKCNKAEKLAILLGTVPLAWMAGRKFDDEVDKHFDPEIDDSIYLFENE